MSPNPFDLDAALAELRQEDPPPAARLRARRALQRRSRPAWRLATVTGALALLLLPVALKTRGSEASALTVQRVTQASLEAPYVFVRDFVVEADGRRTLREETRFGPRRLVERLFFHEDGQSGREIRHLPGLVFERLIPDVSYAKRGWKPYETTRRSKERFYGTEQKTYTRFDDLRKAIGDNVRLQRLPGEVLQPNGQAWVRYRMVSDSPSKAETGTWTVEMPSGRLIDSDSDRIDEGNGRIKVVRREYTYPLQPDPSLIDVPPPGSLPRFDLDQERAEMDRLNREGDRTQTVAGRKVKLVGVFQEICAPGQRVYVAYEGAGLARARGLEGGGLTTMKSIPPKVVATVFETKGPLRTLDVEIPVVGGGYAIFKGVRVRSVSVGIRSALRTPSYE